MLPIWIGHFVQDGLDSSIKWTGGPYFKSQFSVMISMCFIQSRMMKKTFKMR